MTTLTIILYVLGSIYLLDQVVDIIEDRIDEYKERQADNNTAKILIANHPEMKGVKLGEGADLLSFGADKELRKMILDNNDPGDNIPLQDDSKFNVVVADTDDLDDDDNNTSRSR
jgi:hypothetical protein